MLTKIREAFARTSGDEGATAVEYGIMVALIAVVIIAAVAFIGQQVNEDFSCVGEAMDDPAVAKTC